VSAPGEELAVLLRRAAADLDRVEAARLSRTRAGLRPAHVAVLQALLRASPLTPGELCARCETEPSTMTGLLRALETRGLLERRRLVRDERSVALDLTPRGRAAARVAQRARVQAQAAVLRALPRGAGAQLLDLLEQLAAAARVVRAEEGGAARRARAPAGREP
jgi:DNA-binding MarR family transcriptional regulator